jgi:hypothetical protein
MSRTLYKHEECKLQPRHGFFGNVPSVTPMMLHVHQKHVRRLVPGGIRVADGVLD